MSDLFRARLLNTSLCVFALYAGRAAAQNVETVTVTGEKYALEKSIDEKRQSVNVTDGISSDEIGSIPEFGLGDALRKVPGLVLQINNGRGEDQFLTVRGLNPDYNSIEIDGLQLPSTEETRRQVSLDVLPSVLVSQVAVNKSWTVDEVSDAAGGVTELKTRSAFDRPGEHFTANVDYAYWEATEHVHGFLPSGQVDAIYSNTFDGDKFGIVLLGSYMMRSSSSLNTYTLGYSYYPSTGVGSGTATVPLGSNGAASSTLSPSSNVTGDIPIPDRHRWYYYDNNRTRPGAFGRLDYNDHGMFHAHLAGGLFEFINNEHRYSQYLNRSGNPLIATATTGSFAAGSPEVDFDKYVQYRQLSYVDAGGGVDFDAHMHLDLTVNYGVGQYKQTTDEDQFLPPSSIPASTFGFAYDLDAPQAPLFTPNSVAAFMNPGNYNMVYHLDQVDTSLSHLPQTKLEFSDNMDSDSDGFGFKAGWTWRELHQQYYNTYNRVNATAATAPTLATTGVINKTLSLYDGEGQSLLLVNPDSARAFVTANPGLFTPFASNALNSTISNYHLTERIQAFYAEAQYKWGDLYALAGLRYENTNMLIQNYQPVPFSSTSNFVATNTPSHYARLLPSLNVSWDVVEDIKLRAAISQNLARPTYSNLAQNGSASVSGNLASESISNPTLKPRESTNYDLSAEWYPAQGVLASVAIFDKEIENEIVTLNTTINNATVPGYPNPVTLTITQAQNADHSTVQGIEFGLSDVKFDFLPDFLSDFGGSGNVSLISQDPPHIRMSDGTLRRLPQLMESSKFVANVSLLYSHDEWSGELAYNYTSKMPISFDTSNAVNDQWWAGLSTLDAQIGYKLDDNISFRVQGKNLLNGISQKVVGPTQQLNYSALNNGRAFWVGVGASF